MKIAKSSVGGKPVWHIKWPVRPISYKAYAGLATQFRRSRDYAPIYNGKLEAFAAQITRFKVPVDAGLSVRNIIIKEKVIHSRQRIVDSIDLIVADYEAGMSILNISVKYDYPPLMLLREILFEIGYDKAQLREVFLNKEDPRDLLEGRHLEEYKQALRYDAESAFNQQLIAELAADNENAFVDWIKAQGIGLRTQDELVQEQVAKHGRALLTPDILFVDEVYINGERVHWIDYKDYVGTKVRFLFDSNSKQAAKYNDHWGPGALCYRHSFIQGLKIPGAQLLDVSALDGLNLRSL